MGLDGLVPVLHALVGRADVGEGPYLTRGVADLLTEAEVELVVGQGGGPVTHLGVDLAESGGGAGLGVLVFQLSEKKHRKGGRGQFSGLAN